MTCSSLYGCYYCKAARGSSEWLFGGARLRTAENIRTNASRLKSSGDNVRARAKDISFNCIENPIIFDDDDDLDQSVLFKCPPPVLHLKLGLNHLLTQLYKV